MGKSGFRFQVEIRKHETDATAAEYYQFEGLKYLLNHFTSASPFPSL